MSQHSENPEHDDASNRQSAVGSQQSAVSDQQSAISNQQSAIHFLRHRWMFDWASPWEYTAHAVTREVFHTRSDFQDIEIVETEGYGRCLLLDGEVQSFEADEHIYHESLVHPALLLHPDPHRVLVIGGGEGATLREVLRHRSVEQAVMVDLDPQMISAAREHLPTFHAGSFDDPRVRLEFGDGRAFVEDLASKPIPPASGERGKGASSPIQPPEDTRSADRFDVIVIDVTNPMTGGPSYRLFTVEFYAAVRRILASNGIVVLQSDAVTLHGLESAATIHRTVRDVWPRVTSYAVFLPAYTTDWSFTLAGSEFPPPLDLAPREVDSRIESRLSSTLRFYDGTTHHRLFHLPRYVRDAFQTYQTINRDSAPMQETLPGFLSGS